MALYSYLKKETKPENRIISLTAYGAMIIGSMFLFWSFYPIISFEIYSRLFIKNKIFSPVPYSDVVSSVERANSVLASSDTFSTNLSDYTRAAVWFPTRPQTERQKLDVSQYTLSIPKLNIKDAKVIVGGDDLLKSLIHYLPTTLPGEYGNVAIFGHSTLPQLYNESDYKTIFTYLPSLEKNDKIYATVDGVTYEYEVFDLFVVNPDQVSVLDPKYDQSYLTLITCVPPGTYWKRLIVRAKLTKL